MESLKNQQPISGSRFNDFVDADPPPDLTPHITRIDDQYSDRGSFGDVYRCWHTDGSERRKVAVKALRVKFTLNDDTEDRSTLRREIGVWKRLSHDNVVPFLGIAYGFGMNGATSLVSLWMPNGTLHSLIATNHEKLHMVHRLQILSDVSKGLQYLHSFPIVHGDLNPSNVLFDADYNARIVDFGFASLAGDIPEAIAYLEGSTVRPGALRWTAPEQIDPEEASKWSIKSDVYSFGCIALQVLSGKVPWSEVRKDLAIIHLLHKGRNPARPKSRNVLDLYWNFIQRCWLPLRERPTAESILLSIQQFLNDYTTYGSLRDLYTSSNHFDKGGHRKSLQLSADLWIKLERESSRQTTSISTDVVVFVLGPTGSGKSWFTKAATKSSLIKVGGELDLKPFTNNIQAMRCELVDETKRDPEWVKNIVFIDSPSFLTGYDCPDARNELRGWLDQIIYEPRCVGMIYMHRIETDPALEPIEAHLQEFSRILQIEDSPVPQKLCLVVSHDKASGIISNSKVAKRRAKLYAQLATLDQSRWKASMHDDNFHGETEVAWKAVEELFRNHDT